MIDTHAHLDGCELPPHELVARARAAGVVRVITIGSGIPSCRASLEICEREPGVFAALGIHPHQAGDLGEGDLDDLRLLLDHSSAVAVGETGLDYYRDYAPRPRQAELFRAQVSLACELGKAVVVHTRAADDDTLAVLAELAPPTVVLHCFSSLALLPAALERRYFVSFAGNVTYPNAADLRLASTRVPADRLLVETDSPYLAPQVLRGRRNEPANVVHVLDALAGARGEEPDVLAGIVDENASRAFGLP